MARVTVEDCLPHVENRFSLVLLATLRTRQLMDGAAPVVENPDKNKNPVLALREIAAEKVRFDRSVKAALRGDFDDDQKKATKLRPLSEGGSSSIPNVPESHSSRSLDEIL